jgi:2-methylcitrate dehydratase PrpD
MMREHGLHPDEIESIEVRRGRAAERPAREIRNQMDAWMVPSYTIAAGVYDVRPRRSWQEPDTFRRADLLALMLRIHLQPLSEGEVTSAGNYWEHWSPIRVTIRARSRSFEGAQDHMPVLDDEALGTKFHENVGGFLASDAAQRVEQACRNLGVLGHARQLAQLLSAEV